MCEAKPGNRCSGHAAEARDKAQARYDAAHPGGPEVDPLTSARETVVATIPRPQSASRWTANTVEEAFEDLPSGAAARAERPWVPAKESAAAMRHDLKARFGQPFSVTMSRGTAYGWARVEWADGPRWNAVEGVTFGYQSENFNGMTDSYDQVNGDAPVRYSLSGVNHTRTMGPAGQKFVASIFQRAGLTDFDGGKVYDKDLSSSFRSDRRLTEQEQHAILRVLNDQEGGIGGFSPYTFESANSAARYIHSRTDFSGKKPVFDWSAR